MKLIEKIKNWIIKKLGGYTEEELVVEADKGVKVFDLVANEATRLAMYWHQRYTTEHEAYLALLNCHNAAVEQKQDVTEMAKAIKEYCKAQNYCENCELADESGVCKLANSVPCYWEVE